MKLKSYHVTDFKNVDDSNVIDVDPAVTCFVGKNEAGKTALLQALYRFNPIIPESFDEIKEYPRKGLLQYQRAVEAGKEKSAKVITATFNLEDNDVEAIASEFGNCIKPEQDLTVSLHYDGTRTVSLQVDESNWVQHYIENIELSEATLLKVKSAKNLGALVKILGDCEDDALAVSSLAELKPIEERSLIIEIWSKVLKARIPQIFLFDDYRVMKGSAPLNAITGSLDKGVNTLEDLLALAGVTPAELQDNTNYEHHKAKLEAIANEITDDVFHYWKQNSSLEVMFDVHRAPGNQPGEFHIRIKNNKHRVTVPFDERSRGFVWFFSFLATFKKLSEDHDQLIILLDEPGLNLHASAQADLLNFIEDILAPKHQVLYTTHSPFMIDAHRLERVRTVEDVDSQGVKVSSECLSVDSNTVFPLQAAMGYSLAQTLFLGPNCLLVEGPSDLLYLQIMSNILESDGREPLSDKWVITPVGGADKLATFATLIGANQLNACVLMDVSQKDKQRVGNLIKNNFLNKKQVVQLNDFVESPEADIEDLFEQGEYMSLVRLAYPALAKKIKDNKLGKQPRIIKRIETCFADCKIGQRFNHFAPSRVALTELGTSIELHDETKDRFEAVFKKLNSLIV